MLKKLVHKLLFIIPLFGLISLYAINPTLNKNQKPGYTDHKNQDKLKSLTFYFEIEEDNDWSSVFYVESELENDIELDWFFNANLEIFTTSISENQKLYNKTSFFLTQKRLPLYDLFCSWKHHLS